MLHALKPYSRVLIIAYFQIVVTDVDHTYDGIAIADGIRVMLDVVEVGAIGLFQTVESILVAQSQSAPAATYIDEHIGIFAGSVAAQTFESFGSGYGHFQGGFIFCPCIQKTCQTVGNAGIYPHVFFIGRVLNCRNTRLPIQFGHAFPHQSVVGITHPVAGLTLRE